MSPPNEIKIDQSVDQIAPGGKANALEIEKYEGSLTLQVFGSSPKDTRRFHAPPTSKHGFVDREREITQLVTVLESRKNVFINGMPGIGKTAVAIAGAHMLHEKGVFQDGILWVSDIGNAPAEMVCEAIARRLGDKEIANLPSYAKLDATRDLLAGFKNLLVVLDHVESGETAQDMVDCVIPQTVSLLMISRMRHSIDGEEITIQPLKPESAARLFRETAGVADGEDDLVDEICTLLGLHPLALVIAARRVRFQKMPLQNLRNRINNENTLATLTLGNRNDKDASVWASLNLSYTGLNSDQTLVLTHLACCFDHSTGIELLSLVCNLTVDKCEDYIGQLVACSLVERSGNQVTLQRLVRDFGRERLGDQLITIQQKVVSAVTRFVEKYAEKNPANFDALEQEIGNLVGAVRHTAARTDWPTAVDLAKRLGLTNSGMLSIRGYWTELIEIGRIGMQAAERTGDLQAVTRFKHNTAAILENRGDFSEAEELYQENLKTFIERDDKRGIALTLHNLGVSKRSTGDYPAALDYLSRSREIKEKPEFEKYLSSTLHELGQLAEHQCDWTTAISYYQKSIELDGRLNDVIGAALNYQQIGRITQVQGNCVEARRLYKQSLDVFRNSADKVSTVACEIYLARLDIEQGDYEEAFDLLQRSCKDCASLGARWLIGESLYTLGLLFQEKGQLAEALSNYEQSLKVSTLQKAVECAAFCQVKLGALAREKANFDEAAELLNDSSETFEKLGNQVGTADNLHEAGNLAAAKNKADEAEELYLQSLDIRDKVGHMLGEAHSCYALGQLKQMLGKNDEARAYYQKSLDLFKRLVSPYSEKVARSLETIAS